MCNAIQLFYQTLLISVCYAEFNYTLEGFVNVDPFYNQTILLKIAPSISTLQLTLTGVDFDWMGFGFGNIVMNSTYAIVVDGSDTGTVYEYVLGNHERGTQLSSMVNIKSNTVLNGERTVILTRNLNGTNNNYYSFPTVPCNIPIIWANGYSSQPIYNTSTTMEFSNANVLILKQIQQ
eukprot:41467_1